MALLSFVHYSAALVFHLSIYPEHFPRSVNIKHTHSFQELHDSFSAECTIIYSMDVTFTYITYINRCAGSHCTLNFLQFYSTSCVAALTPSPAFITGVSSCLKWCHSLPGKMLPKCWGISFLWVKIHTKLSLVFPT